jgi:hypothetical protein
MSFFGKIEHVFEEVETEAKRILGNSATWDKTASATLTFVAPLLETVLALTAGAPASAAASKVVSRIQTDLAIAATVISTGEATPTLTGALNDIQTNLSGLLKVAQVSDPVTVAKVNAVTNTILAEVKAIVASLPTVTA